MSGDAILSAIVSIATLLIIRAFDRRKDNASAKQSEAGAGKTDADTAAIIEQTSGRLVERFEKLYQDQEKEIAGLRDKMAELEKKTVEQAKKIERLEREGLEKDKKIKHLEADNQTLRRRVKELEGKKGAPKKE